MFSRPHDNIEYLDLSPGLSVIDCGAGSGEYALRIARSVGETGHVYVVDVQKDLLRRIETEGQRANIHTIKSIWTDLDTPTSLSAVADDTIDRILVANTLFQLENPQYVFAEAFRVLKKGGLLMCIDWTDSFNGIGPRDGHIIHQDVAQQYATQAGFVIKNSTCDVGPHHYGFIVQK